MKKIIFILTCIILFCVGFAGVIGWRVWHVKKIVVIEPEVFTAHPTEYMFEPPRQSLAGIVSVVGGEVLKLEREDREPHIATESSQIVEGEKILTQLQGSAEMQFADHARIRLQPNTTVTLVSTNPNNFLLALERGTISLQTDETIATVSARAQHGLIQLENGKAELSLDPETNTLTFFVDEGVGQIGYIDSDNNTQTKQITAGEAITFDDKKRIVKVR